MGSVFQARNYREIVEFRLRGPSGPRRKGVNALASALRCHPTFVAKVLSARADFSMEQALAFVDYFAFPEFEAEFFVALVQLARAGDERTRRFFEARLQTMRQAQLDLDRHLGRQHQPSADVQNEYYNSWIPQFIHITCQTEGRHTVKTLAQQTQQSEDVIETAVRLLLRGGILVDEQGTLKSVIDFLHLPRQPYVVSNMHQQWRMKAANDIAATDPKQAIHFSGLMSIDKATAEKIRELLTDALKNVKPLVAAAASRQVHFLGIDFYRMRT